MAESDQNQKRTWKKKHKKQIIESWLGPPPSKESRNIVFLYFFCFSKVFTSFQRVLAGTPPSKESRNCFCFSCFLFCFFLCVSKVFNKCGVLQGNWHESQAKLSKCLWECSKTSVKDLKILNHGETALPGEYLSDELRCFPAMMGILYSYEHWCRTHLL